VRDIGQSIPYPGATNTITVTLATNVPVTDEAVVSISGLIGGDAAPGITPSSQSGFCWPYRCFTSAIPLAFPPTPTKPKTGTTSSGIMQLAGPDAREVNPKPWTLNHKP